MPVSFDVNTITIQGATAIASATAGNKLIIDGCDATTTTLTKAQAVQVSSRPASPASTTTSIALAGSTENHVYAYASFIQGETGQPGGDVHTFYLYGHMDDAPSSVFVISICSSTNPVHLPEQGDVVNRAEVQFELTFSATDEVVTVADTSIYATRGEFLLLKNRTVTTHAEGDATTGEAQDIYGNKRFMNIVKTDNLASATTSSIYIGNNLVPYGAANIGSESEYFPAVYTHSVMMNHSQASTTIGHELFSNILGDGDTDITKIGVGTMSEYASDDTTYRENSGLFCESEKSGPGIKHSAFLIGNRHYSSTTTTKARLGFEWGPLATYSKIIGEAGTSSFTLDSNGFVLTNAGLSVGGDLSLTGSVTSSIIPDTNDEYNLGSNTYRWGNLYSTIANVSWISQLDQYGIVLDGSIYPSSGSSIGDSNRWLTDLYAITVNATNVYTEYLYAAGASIETDATILPYTNEAQDLGSNDKKFYEVYARNLHGVIDHPTSTSSLPIGSIFFAALQFSSTSSAHDVNIGDEISVSASDNTKPIHIASAAFYYVQSSTESSYFMPDSNRYFDDGIYRALSSGHGGSGVNLVFVLLIKVGTVS